MVVVSLYTALALGATWPLARDFGTRVIGDVWFDQRHSIWLIWHVKEVLLGHQTLVHASMIYHPFGISTLVDGLGPLSGVLALPFWTWGPVAAYNGAMLIGFVLTGWCMYLLARHLSLDTPFAFATGVLLMLWPIHLVAVYGHLEKAFMGLLPLNVLAGLLALNPRRRIHWVWAPALTLLLTLLQNGNQFIFALLALGLVAVIQMFALPRSEWRKLAARIVLCTAAAVLVNGLLLREFFRAANDPTMQVALAAHSAHYSPDALQFLLPSIHQASLGRWIYPNYEIVLPDFTRGSKVSALSATPGWYGSGIETAVTIPLISLVLSVAALLYRRSVALPWLAFGLFFAVLSWGPYVRIGGRTTFSIYEIPVVLPYAFLSSIDGFNFMRTPGRFMMMGAVGFSLVAGMGLASLRKRWPRSKSALATLAIAVLVVECWPRPWGQQVPLPVPPFYEQLARETGKEAVLDLPPAVEGSYASAYQWYQLTHGKPIAWGYLSRAFLQHPIPPIQAIIEERVSNASEIRRQLVQFGYRYVVWHKHGETLFLGRSPQHVGSDLSAPVDAQTNSFIRAALGREQPLVDDHLTTVYRLAPAPISQTSEP